MGPEQGLSLRDRVDLGVMAMKGYYTFPKALGLDTHHQMQFDIIYRTSHWVEKSYPSVGVPSAYSSALADWAGVERETEYFFLSWLEIFFRS